MGVPLATIDDAELSAVFDEVGAPSWRVKQLRLATWRPAATEFDAILELPQRLRTALAERLVFSTARVEAAHEADHGNTLKLLARLADGQTVETVAMETPGNRGHRRRATVCVSSQVGCAVGCPFCATGQMGLRRSCSAAEIVDQVRLAATALAERGLGPVTHVVYMGMGEPLAAYRPVLQSLAVLTTSGGLSGRRITVSTSGVVPRIRDLAAEGPGVTLAISLHAATDELRDRLVPLNRRYPIDELCAAAADFRDITGRRVSLEWCLIGDVNDSDEQADGLRELAFRLRAHVNVIPMNHVDGSPWGPPEPARTRRFMGRLEGVPATVRDTRGQSSEAACGQLRAGLERRRVVQSDGMLSAPRAVHAPA